jgi:glycosyltransferase involved in cell wall biosynthesis
VNLKNHITILIPIYNEEKILTILVRKIDEWIEKFPLEAQFAEFIFLNDGSSDKSLIYLDSCKISRNNFNVYSSELNLGYGGILNLSRNLDFKKSSFILVLDSDLTNPLDTLNFLINENLSDVNYIKFSRYKLGGSMINFDFKQNMISKTGNFVSKILTLFFVSDPTNGLRACTPEYWKLLRTNDTTFASILEELHKTYSLGAQIREVPTTLDKLSAIRSHSSLRININLIFSYLYYSAKIGKERLLKVF